MNFTLSLLQACFKLRFVCLTLSPNSSFPFVGITEDTVISALGNLYMRCFSVSEQVLTGIGFARLSLTPVCIMTPLMLGFSFVSFKRIGMSVVLRPPMHTLVHLLFLEVFLCGFIPLIVESPMRICVEPSISSNFRSERFLVSEVIGL